MKFSHTRRDVLGRLLWLGGSTLFVSWPVASCRSAPDSDKEIFLQKYTDAATSLPHGKPFGDLVAAVALSFHGSPYVGHTLEVSGPERLVVNLREFDCLTLVESSLSIARCVRLGTDAFDEYRKQLQRIRYRSGVINAYPSRLHYFTDWAADNQRKGIVNDVTGELGGLVRDEKIDFMSTHRGSYRQLKSDEFIDEIKEAEQRLSHTERYYIPQHSVEAVLESVRTGDIVGFTSTIEGLDIAHTGLAYRSEDEVKLLHASSAGGAVEISEGSLADYVVAQKKQDGLILIRPVDPA
jgi:hypothetical protein